MEIALRRAGCPYQPFDYPGTEHWFAESARPDAFDPDAAALARSRDLTFLAAALAQPLGNPRGDGDLDWLDQP